MNKIYTKTKIMPTVRKTITLTDKQDEWIKSQIKYGGYTNDSEYIRHLVRQDQNQNAEFFKIKLAIEEGLESGISDMDIPKIMKEVEDRRKNGDRL